RPRSFTSSGCMPGMPSSSSAASPSCRIFCSNSALTFSTISSMRAGWMRPSTISRSRATRATSRRNGSKPERITASGVSSTMRSTPVAISRADVAPFAADDAPLHLVAGQHDDRDGGLGDVVRSRPLDGHADDALRLPAGLLAGLVLDALDDVGGLHAGVVLHHPHQLLARLLGGQAGDLLQLGPLFLEHRLHLDLALLDAFLAAGERAVELGELLVPPRQVLGLLLEAVLFLGEAPLLGLELGAALARHRLELGAGLEELFLGGDVRLAQAGLARALGVLDQLLRFALRLLEQALAHPAEGKPPDEKEHDRADEDGY